MTKRKSNRTHKYTMLLSPQERDMLQALSEAEGLDASDFLRQYIRKAWRDRKFVIAGAPS